jgi:hypothetical protein
MIGQPPTRSRLLVLLDEISILRDIEFDFQRQRMTREVELAGLLAGKSLGVDSGGASVPASRPQNTNPIRLRGANSVTALLLSTTAGINGDALSAKELLSRVLASAEPHDQGRIKRGIFLARNRLVKSGALHFHDGKYTRNQ